MKHQARRVVTGHDSDGRSVVLSDSIVDAFEASPAAFATRLWATDTFPSDNTDPWDGAELIETFSTADGTAFYIVDWAPNSEFPFHRTQSLDCGVVMSGQLEAVMDGGDVAVLTTGDSIVQRGTMHVWRNSTDQWARTVFVLVGTSPVTAGGQTLEPNM
ncbi:MULTISPECIES: cupin domain-containing protein [Rhodococcus]|uniref:cupin domain-containing protein n=1 Tax=Rhodococcus TaxID=1827 RepID=UPI000A894562|nr:cupin domain-containing protein [Rhodococcus opacus]